MIININNIIYVYIDSIYYGYVKHFVFISTFYIFELKFLVFTTIIYDGSNIYHYASNNTIITNKQI